MITRPFLLALLMLGLHPVIASSTAEAESFLKNAVSQVVTVAKNAPDGASLANQLKPLLEKSINFDAMTRRAVGPGWRQFTNDQQVQAIRLFTTLVIRSYSGKFTPGELPSVDFKSAQSPAPSRVEVDTVTIYKGSNYDVLYRLELLDAKGWHITDIVIEGVSMVANYRSQFDARFKAGGAEGVIGSLEKSTR
jgi:phospholipid transport system substrate-binding protein